MERTIMRMAVALGMVAVLAACTGGGRGLSSQYPPGSLKIVSPPTGTTVNLRALTVSGAAPPGSRIVRDISFGPDEEVIAGTDGRWTMTVHLDEGANELVFRIGDDRSTEVRLGVTYRADESPGESRQPGDGGSPQPAPASTAPPPKVAVFGDGTHIIGQDIKPGTYRLREPASFCYWARLKGFGGTVGEIVANENVIGGYAVVTIAKGDKGFESQGCGEWSADLSSVNPDRKRISIDGTYLLHVDILAGTWKSSGGDFCYWSRLRGFGGTIKDIIANDNVLGGSAVVTIAKSDKGFQVRGCGTWSRR